MTGLKTVAVPVRVAGTLAAVLFCCARRPTDAEGERRFTDAVRGLEAAFGLAEGQLLQYAARLPDNSDPGGEKALARAQRVIEALTRLGADRLALYQAQQQDRWRLKAIRALQVANQRLNDLSISWDAFWRATATLWMISRPSLGRCVGWCWCPDGARAGICTLRRRCAACHPSSSRGGCIASMTRCWASSGAPRISTSCTRPTTIWRRGRSARASSTRRREIGARLGREVLIPMFFEDQRNGLVVFFLDQEPAAPEVLVIDSSTGDSILAQSGSLIGAAFNNRQFVQRRHQQHKFKRAWLETVTHQFVAPLSAVQGHAELLTNRLARWENRNPANCLPTGPSVISSSSGTR